MRPGPFPIAASNQVFELPGSAKVLGEGVASPHGSRREDHAAKMIIGAGGDGNMRRD